MCDVCKHFGIGPQPYEGDFQGCWILSHPCTVEERRLSAETGNLETSDSAALGEYETAASVPIWLLQTAKVGMLMGEQAFRAPPCLRGPSRATSLMISRGATEGKHVNWTELQIVPGTIVPYARTDRGEPRKTSFIQVAWRRTNSRSCRHTLRELNLRVSRLKTCSFVEADALLRPCVSSSAPPGAVQVWKRNLQGNTRCRTAWHLEL
ncbi:uncharacterized protein LOC111863799 isoform X3 [Cryptotermes secundus]|uniref:uncharacterized protein LOC111863799 isoform X3 n=1 Tax=Cryptotermes secundus TaxID=105785 RepID=UPI001454D0BF|nr:uncharacterized protein LOC111863799 isoform X3 [Cryptotermes secundus]